MAGYLRDELSDRDYQNLQDTIQSYRDGTTGLEHPLAAFYFCSDSMSSWLANQSYLRAFDAERKRVFSIDD